jgi:hypothetical protein
VGVKLPRSAFRVDHGCSAAQAEGDQQGAISFSAAGRTGDGQAESGFFALGAVELNGHF